MGLSDSGINACRTEIDSLKSYKSKLTEDLAELQSAIRADANFQKFVAGTDVGQRNDELINKIIEIAGRSGDSTDGVISTTYRFLDEQHRANVEKARLQEEKARGDI